MAMLITLVTTGKLKSVKDEVNIMLFLLMFFFSIFMNGKIIDPVIDNISKPPCLPTTSLTNPSSSFSARFHTFPLYGLQIKLYFFCW